MGLHIRGDSMPLTIHLHFIEQAIQMISQDNRFVGLLAGGSMITGTMDEFSDIDLILVYQAAYREEIMKQRLGIAEGMGSLLFAFTGST
jgi:UTP:GlnB (protein PII) uridylyltransferase